MLNKKHAIAAEYYHKYINASTEKEVLKAIKKNSAEFEKLLKKIPSKKLNHAYAEGKWTIKELLQHIIDAERVFAYRALRIARMDTTPLSSFDENSWASHSRAPERRWADLVKEFRWLRKSTEILFASFDEDQLLAKGTASNHEINVLALGYIIPGHVEHHINIIKEKYLGRQPKAK
ncbi:MAG: DinB family protein [Bacteroidetes bacterium]|nr:DinB family protein [Bacteroidota bacterium]MBS1974740.1 DinB family protein [Bacteroidota bacterium]